MSDFLDFDPDGEDVVNREVIPHEDAATERSVARRLALQALYEIDSAGHEVSAVLHNLLSDETLERKVRSYTTHIVQGVDGHRSNLDTVLQQYATEWPINQVAVVDRNILRIALFEMGIESRTPIGVAIDEAIELAKLFGADNAPRFINGVLGTIADKLGAIRQFLAVNNPPTPGDDTFD